MGPSAKDKTHFQSIGYRELRIWQQWQKAQDEDWGPSSSSPKAQGGPLFSQLAPALSIRHILKKFSFKKTTSFHSLLGTKVSVRCYWHLILKTMCFTQVSWKGNRKWSQPEKRKTSGRFSGSCPHSFASPFIPRAKSKINQNEMTHWWKKPILPYSSTHSSPYHVWASSSKLQAEADITEG